MHTNRCIRSDGDTICSADCTHEAESERDQLLERVRELESALSETRDKLENRTATVDNLDRDCKNLRSTLANVREEAREYQRTLESALDGAEESLERARVSDVDVDAALSRIRSVRGGG